MYLKRIELAGFKSFADRTQLELGPGITAVVGPNGSGKSNVADAIRWVLGEQSAKSLRGAKMEEVIFAGSDRRRSVGMAEVSLTLDNSDRALPLDYREVTVTRRLFRTGDSEYLLNGNACRLKDIVELFMDTGVGKESYSIIGQGKIDEVLNAKPEDRRMLFEEAAGISKHKHRKREALRRLDEVAEQLQRLRDIMGELERQVGPLREQAAKAEAYLATKEELKGIELQVFDLEINELQKKRTVVAGELDRATDLLSRGQADLGAVDSALTEKRWRQAQVSDTMEQLTQEMLALVQRLERQSAQLGVFDERERGLRDQIGQAENQASVMAVRIGEVQQKLDELRHGIADLLAAQHQAAATLAQHQQALRQWELDEQQGADRFDALQQELLGLIEQSASLESLCLRLGEEQSNLKAQRQQTANEQAERGASVLKAEQAVREGQETAASLKRRVMDAQTHLDRLRSRLLETRQRLDAGERQLSALTARQASAQARLRTLTAMERSLDGYQRGVKAILQAKRNDPERFRGVIDTVADLLTVPSHLEVAVEIALGGALQNLVTVDEEAARSAIEFLKQTHGGRATFLPLSIVSGRQATDAAARVSGMPGWIGIGAALVTVESRYQSIIDHLLGQVFIMEDLPTALEAARVLGHRYRIVTLGGDVIYPGGAMTGGSVGRREATLLGRGREKDEIVQELAALAREKTERIRSQQLCQREVAEAAVAVQEQEQVLQQVQQALRDQTSHVTVLEQELNRAQAEEQRCVEQLMLISQRVTQMEAELSTRRNELDRVLQRRRDHESALAQMRRDDGSRREQRRVLDEAIAESRWRAELQARELEKAEHEQASLEQELSQSQANHLQIQSVVKQWQLQLDQLLEERRQIQQELADLSRRRGSMEERLETLRAERSALSQEIESYETKASTLRTQVDQLRETQYGHQVRLAKLESELQGFIDRLWADYQLIAEDLGQMLAGRERQGRRFLIDRSAQLRQEIRAMGLVNLGAIEELARVQERLAFLSAQQADMDTARRGLLQVIEEMEQVMTARFSETFRAVNRAFAQVFVELFGGGSAQLVLTDPEQLLSSGVEIIAQPPGKKPSGLAMLSGGERALTAIALLFAILRWRPTPFCVLDEIEASLDESNVTRLAAYLKEYARKSQFIVITHRKGTMEVADLLIGVTMQSLGVSTIMNLRLANPDAAASAEDALKVN